MLKHLKKVGFLFNPLDRRSASALEFLAQCNNLKAREANPDCEIIIRRKFDSTPPLVKVTYNNGKEEIFKGDSMTAQSMRKRVLEQAEYMETEQMFKEAGFEWPVVFTEEEIKAGEPKPKKKFGSR